MRMKAKKAIWTNEQEDYLLANWDKMSHEAIAGQIGLTLPQVKSKCKKMGLIKTAEIRSQILKLAPKRKRKVYDNSSPDGTITYRTYSGEKGRPWIKEGGKWMPLHIHNWIKAGNELPPKCVLKFRDGNPLNCEASNLYLVTRGEDCRHTFTGRKRPEKRAEKRGAYKKKGPTKKELLAQQRAERKQQRQAYRESILGPYRLALEEERYRKRKAREAARLERESQKHESSLRSKQRLKPKQQEKKKAAAPVIQPKKRVEKVYQMKPVDTSQLVAVRIDRKTIVYAKPGVDIEAVRMKYQSLRKTA